MNKLLSTMILLGTGVAACATGGPLKNTEAPAAAIRSAEEVGAARSSKAALHLQLAKEQLERAKAMSGDNNAARAQLLLQRSHADAELALALARSDAARGAAQKAVERSRKQQMQAR